VSGTLVRILRSLKLVSAPAATAPPVSGFSGGGSWIGGIWWPREAYAGAWQQNYLPDTAPESLLTNSVVYCCVTGIAMDIAKNRIKLERNIDGIWTEITDTTSPFWPVLRKPNHYQTRIKFMEQWILSKLLDGNTYVLKERDQRGIVVRLYVLHPRRVTVLVADDGSVWYALAPDPLSQLPEQVTVPASEIIHDMAPSLYHPLCGVSPLTACYLSATMANRIQVNSTNFFGNRSMPGGVLTAVGHISDDTAKRLKTDFETNYSGPNVGKVAVLGDGLKFEAIGMTAEASQLAEQLGFTVQDVARAFHYPGFKLGGPMPPYAGNIEALITSYYTDCLQEKIESIEVLLDEGLELPADMGTEFDLDNLLRMDTGALYESNNKAVGGGWMAPNEARKRANYKKVDGGESPYMQQQNYSLEALAKRDAQPDPFAKPPSSKPPVLPAAAPPAPAPPAAKEYELDELEALYVSELRRELKEHAS